MQGAVRCAGCHQHPLAAAATKARDKAKGTRKLRAADVALNHRLVSWRVVGGAGDGPAATDGYNYRGADLEVAAPRGISDLYDLVLGLQAAPGGQKDDADGTAAAADTDKI
ncbi:hypothetical protein D1007_14240 [Hordeum vulgare]|nr:hypothetical protein D1007_14240 [Hordeum vulgare]